MKNIDCFRSVSYPYLHPNAFIILFSHLEKNLKMFVGILQLSDLIKEPGEDS